MTQPNFDKTEPITHVESVTEDWRGLSFTATKIYCPHGEWPAYTCRTCHPPIAWWRRAIVWLIDFTVGRYDRL